MSRVLTFTYKEITITPNMSLNSPVGSKNTPNLKNISNNPGGFESKESSFGINPQRAKTVRQATTTVINTRAGFAKFLHSSGLRLLTSAVEFQRTGDFIQSSVVVYPQNNDYKEPLVNFLERYPDLQAKVNIINESLKPTQEQMQIIS